MLRSPWLGPLAILIAGIAGYSLSDGSTATTLDSVAITIKETRETGGKWDFGGGLPDPRISVEQAGTVLATCEHENVLKATCRVGAAIDRDRGPVRVVVIDVDTSDDDLIGEANVDLGGTKAGTGALLSVEAKVSGGGAWARFFALWIALAIGVAIALALSIYRRRHA